MATDEYDKVSRGKLKLKVNVDMKKKKKKKKDKEKLKEHIQNMDGGDSSKASTPDKPQTSTGGRPLTKAEKTFKEMQEKMQTKRIMEKAAMTHKQRVEKFNQHLDSLTEHFDIPKVSWTK